MTDIDEAITDAVYAFDDLDLTCTCPPSGPRDADCPWSRTDADIRAMRVTAFKGSLNQSGFVVTAEGAGLTVKTPGDPVDDETGAFACWGTVTRLEHELTETRRELAEERAGRELAEARLNVERDKRLDAERRLADLHRRMVFMTGRSAG